MTAEVIRSVQPDAQIIGNVASPALFDYINDFLDNVDKKYLNVFSYHIYTTVPEYRTNEATAQLRKMLKNKNFTNTELWQGESGYPSWAYKGHWLVKDGCNDETAQAVYQLRRYFIDIFDGAKLSSFFQMADMWEKPYVKKSDVIPKCAAQGILNGITYTPKKSYETIRYLSTIFSGDIKPTDEYFLLTTSSQSPIDSIACRKMTFEKNGIKLYAYYYPSDLAEHKEISFDAIVSILQKIDEPILIDPMNGDVFEVCEPAYKKGFGYVYTLPLKEYPMILTDKKVFVIE